MKQASKKNSPSSIRFLAIVQIVNALMACFWLMVPASLPAQLMGLSLSFLFLVVIARNIWEINLLKGSAEDEPAGRPANAIGELQGFLVDHLQFAVITLFPSMRFRLETTKVPERMKTLKVWENRDFGELLTSLTRLPQNEIATMAFQLEHAFGMDSVQWNVTLLGLPKEVQLQASTYVRLSYVPTFENGLLQAVHIIFQDISEIKQREEQAQEQRREMEKFFAVLQVSDSLFELFMSETRRLFEDIKSDLKALKGNTATDPKETANRLFRAVHTIKANSRLFKLNSIQDVAHKVETYLDDLRKGRIRLNQRTIQELMLRIQSISEEVYSYASLRKEILSSSDRNSGLNLKYRLQWMRSLMGQFASVMSDPNFDQSQLELIQREFTRALSSFDRSSLREYLRGYETMLQDMALHLGKEVKLQVSIDFHQFETAVLTKVNDILIHCLRNAVDHGIEPPDEREAAGKPRFGTISLSTRERNGMIEIDLHDDGRGIDVDKVREKAVELGILSEVEAKTLTDDYIVPLLFNVGVSTATTVTEISGRGLGMDVVRDGIYGLNGQLRLSFVKGMSTTISFSVPLASEELLSPLAIHDVNQLLREAVSLAHKSSGRTFQIETGDLVHTNIFADRAVISEAMQLALCEVGSQFSNDRPLRISIHEHRGKRKVDSFVFYRVKIGDPRQTEEKPAPDSMKTFERATQLIRKSGGSLYVRNSSQVEINLPSNIPVPFAEYSFKVLVFSQRSIDLDQTIDTFFNSVMGGWTYKIHRCSKAGELPPEMQRNACLVLLDSRHIKDYVASRDEKDRARDGIILFPEGELDIDALNETGIVPENVLFAPRSFDSTHLHRCLVSIVFRRFLKEMVRDKTDEADPSLLAS